MNSKANHPLPHLLPGEVDVVEDLDEVVEEEVEVVEAVIPQHEAATHLDTPTHQHLVNMSDLALHTLQIIKLILFSPGRKCCYI